MGFPTNPTDTGQMYLRSDFSGNAEAEKVSDFLNNMHPAVALAHATFESRMQDSVNPNVLMDDWPIDRTSSAISNMASAARAAGAAASYSATSRVAPQRLLSKLATHSEAIAASRESQRVRYYGIDNPMDRGISRALIQVLDRNEWMFLAGQATAGTGTTPKPVSHGIISLAAWTGLELRHGTNPALATVGDGIQDIPRKYWTSFYNAQGTPLSRDMFYDQVLSPGWQLGHQTDGAMIWGGPKPMKLFSDMNLIPGRGAINERSIPARDEAMIDVVSVVKVPSFGTMYLVTNRMMGVPNITLDYTNDVGVGPQAGTILDASGNGTFKLDSTILSIMPSELNIEVIDHIHYRELASDGDYSAGMVISQKGLSSQHLFGVIGAGGVVAA